MSAAENLELAEVYGGEHTSVTVSECGRGTALRATLYDASVVVVLTPDEARQLANVLERFAADAEGGE